MSWRTPVTAAMLTCDNFFEPFKDSSGDTIIIELKPREIAHFTFRSASILATDDLQWEILGAMKVGSDGAALDAAFDPDMTFTATNADNDLQPSNNPHYLQTGDGPFRLTTSAADLPSGLAISTDYWIIRNDATDIGLATTLANAIAGTAIALADDGTGTHTLVQSGKGAHVLFLDTAADGGKGDNFYNGIFIHLLSSGAQEFRQIGTYLNTADQVNASHSFDSQPASGDLYDLYEAVTIPDAAGTITQSINAIEGAMLTDEFGTSGFRYLIPRAKSAGGTDAHKIVMTYSIDGVDA